MTTREQPRSISEEQLERLRGALRDNENDLEGTALLYPEEITDLRALLAAYEQAEARADEAEQRADQAEDGHWPYEWQVATAEREKRKKAEAERDTAQAHLARLERARDSYREDAYAATDRYKAERNVAQASEARLRERIDAALDEVATFPHDPTEKGSPAAIVDEIRARLASTPNPEEDR